MFYGRGKGFTLIELMVITAILSILVAVSLPKFANMVQKAKEGRTKGNIGFIRTAIDIYFADNENWPYWANAEIVGSGQIYPADWAFFVPNYIDEIPDVYTGQGTAWGNSTDGLASLHEGKNRISVVWANQANMTVITDAMAGIAHHENSYEYLYYVCNRPSDGSEGLSGTIRINCDLIDTRGKKVISW